MMDLKEIIKWFIPCFHVLLRKLTRKMDVYCILICLFLFSCPSNAASISDSDIDLNYTSNNNSYTKKNVIKNEESFAVDLRFPYSTIVDSNRSMSHTRSAKGRTFGRPLKMMQAILPLLFQMGAASTWAVVAAIVGVKTLAVALIILKLLLVAGAAKFGALFAHKSQPKWEPHQKEIHLHIHNSPHGEDHVPITAWNREGNPTAANMKPVNVLYEPYGGPQTISTPFGNYMRIEPGTALKHGQQ